MNPLTLEDLVSIKTYIIQLFDDLFIFDNQFFD